MTLFPRAYTVKTLTGFFIKQVMSRNEGWIICCLSLISCAAHTINALRAIERNSFIVSDNLFEIPIFTSAVLVSVSTAFLLLMHVTREFSSGVYESYLYGPIDPTSYVQSIFLTYGLLNFLAVVLFPLLWISIASLLIGIPISAAAVVMAGAACLLVNTILLIALFFASAAKRSKAALWYTLLFQGSTIGVLTANSLISRFLVPVKRTEADLFLFFREIFHVLFEISKYISPYTQYYLLRRHYHYSRAAILYYLFGILVFHIVFYSLTIVNSRRRF